MRSKSISQRNVFHLNEADSCNRTSHRSSTIWKATLIEKGDSTQRAELLSSGPKAKGPIQYVENLRGVVTNVEHRENKADARTPSKKGSKLCRDSAHQPRWHDHCLVLQDKLKPHHNNLGTLGSTDWALDERGRTWVDANLSKSDKNIYFVKCAYEARPSAWDLELGEPLVSHKNAKTKTTKTAISFVTQVPSSGRTATDIIQTWQMHGKLSS